MLDLLGVAERRLQPVVGRPQHVLHLGDEGLGLLVGENALVGELLLVQLANGWVSVDLLDHQRLGVRRLVLLVVTEAAVADEVDQHVLAEAAAVGERQPHRGDRRLRVVGVDVDDRHVEPLREVGRVAGRAALVGVGREADLVVRDQVEGAARRVAREVVQVEGLRDDALAGERRVAVQQDGERHRRVVRPVLRRAVGLLGARATLDDGVHGLEVAGVRAPGATPTFPCGVVRVPWAARWYLTSPVPPSGSAETASIVRSPSNSRRIVLVRHPDRVREHVQPPAVRHADHELVRAVLGRQLDRLVEHRDHHVETLERELLLPEEALAEEALHPLHLAEPAEAAPSSRRRRAAAGSGPTRSPAAARRAAGGRRGARARRRSCRM